MEYSEAPSIQNVSRRQQFPLIKWLSKAKFEDQMKSNVTLHPHLNPDESFESPPQSRIYIGKSSQTHTSEGVKYGVDVNTDNRALINLEIIGSVVRNILTGLWELHVSHASAHVVIRNDFFVLTIDDPSAFEWKATRRGEVPAMALRGCIDRFTSEYFYIGKVIVGGESRDESGGQENTMKPRYFVNNSQWLTFNETVPPRFGKVHVGHKCLYVGFNNMELSFQRYDVLCLRPTPAPLSILTRIVLRQLCQHSNEKIEKINSGVRKYLPEYLIQFLKYSSQLSVGEYMIKGERLVRDDGKFELLIERNDDFVCQSIMREKDTENLDASERLDLENQQFKRLIYTRIDSIWLHNFQCVCYRKDGRVIMLKNFFNKSPDYTLSINYDFEPNFKITEMT